MSTWWCSLHPRRPSSKSSRYWDFGGIYGSDVRAYLDTICRRHTHTYTHENLTPRDAKQSTKRLTSPIEIISTLHPLLMSRTCFSLYSGCDYLSLHIFLFEWNMVGVSGRIGFALTPGDGRTGRDRMSGRTGQGVGGEWGERRSPARKLIQRL